MTRNQPNVIVMGGSLGGLTAALFLRHAGCAVTVFERSQTPLAGQGAGIVLHPATIRYFTLHGDVADIQDMSTATNWVRYLEAEGRVAAERQDSYRFGSYNSIYKGLLDAFGADHYHLGEMVTGFEQDEQGVTVHLPSGRTERCDLLVCADGIRSSARNMLLGVEGSLEYAGYLAWRGTLSEHDLSSELGAALEDAIIYHILSQGHMLIYPIPVVDHTEAFINWLWYRNIPEGPQLESIMTDQEGNIHDVSLGPGTVHRENVATLHQDASAMLPEPLADLILKTDQPFIQAVMDCDISHMAFGRICLIGDAAFVGRPHLAVGTAKAAEDGWQLSQAIQASDGDVTTALQQWEPRQLQLGRSVVERNREAGFRLQNGEWSMGEQLAFGLYEIGDSMMS